MGNDTGRAPLADADLAERLRASYGLDRSTAERIIEDVLVSYGDTVEEWVRSRHIRLRERGLRNEQIYRLLQAEVGARRFSSEPLTIRQIRRLIYG